MADLALLAHPGGRGADDRLAVSRLDRLGADKDGAHRASALVGRGLDRLLDGAAAAYSRFLSEPVGVITVVVSDWIPQGDGDLARAAAASGRLALAAARTPAVPLLVAIAAVLAIAVALLSPGLFR